MSDPATAPDLPPRGRPEPEQASTENPYGLQDELQQQIEDALDDERLGDAERIVVQLHSADLADLLERLHPDDRRAIVGLIRPQLREDPEVLTYLNEDIRGDVLEQMAPAELAQALAELDSDDALDIIEELEEDERRSVLDSLPALDRRWAEEGLSFPEFSAGRLMQREFIAVPMFWTVGKTIDYLREAENLPDEFFDIFVVDPRYRPTGDVRISQILRSKRSVRLADLVDEEIRPVPAAMDQEEVAFIFRQYALTSAPVVDDAGRLIGVITVDDVVDVIDEEAEDDIYKLGGIQESDLYLDALNTSRSRITWLVVNLGTAILASAVIGLFEGAIDQLVALAVLMPIVASMGGNAGTQTLTVAVRALAMKELSGRNAARLVWKEILVGLFNGVLLALVTGLVAGVWFGEPMLGIVMAVAMVGTLIVAGLSGALIPLALERLKVDPAVASGVFLTTVTDVVGFFLFLGLAAAVLL